MARHLASFSLNLHLTTTRPSVHIHPLLYFETCTPTETRKQTLLPLPSGVCENQTKLGHQPFIFSLVGTFLAPPLHHPHTRPRTPTLTPHTHSYPLSSFLIVHICQWFVNQPAKFTTLWSNGIYSWLCCM